jgi:hypothetical protein
MIIINIIPLSGSTIYKWFVENNFQKIKLVKLKENMIILKFNISAKILMIYSLKSNIYI